MKNDKTSNAIWIKMQFAESVPLVGNVSKDNLDKLLKPIDPPVSFALVDTTK